MGITPNPDLLKSVSLLFALHTCGPRALILILGTVRADRGGGILGVDVSCGGFLADDLAPDTTGVDVLEGSNLSGCLNSFVVTEESSTVCS